MQKSVLFAKYMSPRYSFDSWLLRISSSRILPTNETVFGLLILLVDTIFQVIRYSHSVHSHCGIVPKECTLRVRSFGPILE